MKPTKYRSLIIDHGVMTVQYTDITCTSSCTQPIEIDVKPPSNGRIIHQFESKKNTTQLNKKEWPTTIKIYLLTPKGFA